MSKTKDATHRASEAARARKLLAMAIEQIDYAGRSPPGESPTHIGNAMRTLAEVDALLADLTNLASQ